MIYLIFLFSLCSLAFGGDLLIKGSVSIAHRLRVSPLLIGIILIGFGTSVPELMASLVALYQTPPAPGIVIGNVIGSNIANILLVLGIACVIRPLKADKNSFKRDRFFLILSAIMLPFIFRTGNISFLIGIGFIALLIVYVINSYLSERTDKKVIHEITQEVQETKVYSLSKSLLCTAIGFFLVILGAKYLVSSSITMARHFGVSETVIGFTFIAIGTSIPELTTAIIASLKKQNDIAFGNVVGSNIYNILFILGTGAMCKGISIPSDSWFSLWIMLFATFLLVFLGSLRTLSRWIGGLFLILYLLYIYWII